MVELERGGVEVDGVDKLRVLLGVAGFGVLLEQHRQVTPEREEITEKSHTKKHTKECRTRFFVTR